MALEELPRQPGQADGRQFWRGIEQLVETEEFREYLGREFPEQASEWIDPVTRRQFLTLMGASLALAGLSGCSTQPAPREKIMPYVRQPEELVPGKPLFFATAVTLSGVATGILVESHEGRPTKIEGNPDHPASLGGTDAFTQASVLGLYDPDRSKSVTYRGMPRGWTDAMAALRTALDKLRNRNGAGLRLLTEEITSPTLAGQLEDLLKTFPEAKWVQYEPAASDTVLAGAHQAFGEYVNTRYDFTKADVVLALDADFLASGAGNARYARDFSARRGTNDKSPAAGKAAMNRLYVVESTSSCTGAVADHRLPLSARRIEQFARALATELKLAGTPPAEDLPDGVRAWVSPLVRDLEKNKGSSIVLVGATQPASVHALVHAINDKLGNAGKTVFYTAPREVRPGNRTAGLRELIKDMNAGRVEFLMILGGNPLYTAPADLEFDKALDKVPLRLHHGLYQDETAVRCDWHIPEAHYLESWSDARAFDGTATIMQPLIAPLYEGRSAHELLAALTEQAERTGHEIVRSYWRDWWQKHGGAGDFEILWQKSVQDGRVPGTAFEEKKVRLGNWAQSSPDASHARAEGGLEIVFHPDPTLYDGRFANNGWLQELPKPITKLTWDNAALMSPATAKKLGLTGAVGKPGINGGEHGQAIVDVIELTYQGRKLKTPVWAVPGHADDSITIHLGHGRKRAGKVGTGVGFDAYQLRTSTAPWFDTGLEVRPTGEKYTLACTQMHHAMEGRAPVRTGTLEQFQKHPHFANSESGEKHAEGGDRRLVPLTLYPATPSPTYKWGMAIDLSKCTGCSACVIACQAENNIPVVGKEQVTRGREMHWIRVDRYYEGDPFLADQIRAFVQPVPCMHCEKAPCELVCPVGATVHSHDGLNDMVYNRCVGTRYCSNNCPYKVRRFNFLQFADYTTASLKLLRNPNVTVRTRGVMEKCTYCVQRIRAGEIESQKRLARELAAIEEKKAAGRISSAQAASEAAAARAAARIPDADEEGGLKTACQAACPAQAILFGDLNNKESAVSRAKANPLNYGLLAELNTEPRTTYLAALRNPNPEMPRS
jgi:molybdopterin-containing oxidoreductase family iron-sulfur binding subunit